MLNDNLLNVNNIGLSYKSPSNSAIILCSVTYKWKNEKILYLKIKDRSTSASKAQGKSELE
jgi:hypothetical protein